MKFKKLAALMLTGVMALSVVACGGGDNKSSNDGTQSADAEDGIISYMDLDLDKDCKDLTAEISFSSNRTDMDQDDYPGKNWKSYMEDFNKLYPNIKVNINTSDPGRSVLCVQQRCDLIKKNLEFLANEK